MRSLARRCGLVIYRLLTLGCATEFSFSRFKMYRHIQHASTGLDFTGPVLSISHSSHLLGLVGADGLGVVEANYPEASLSRLPFADASFGLVVSDQVLEHVEALPSIAMRESLRVLRPGGWVLHTTCFRTPYHGPGDYWRFTAEGLRFLALCCGASEATSGTEGHPVEGIVNMLGWTRLGVPRPPWHPLRWIASCNRPSYGSTVWVLARR